MDELWLVATSNNPPDFDGPAFTHKAMAVQEQGYFIETKHGGRADYRVVSFSDALREHVAAAMSECD